MTRRLRIQQVRSGIRCNVGQKRTLQALGLRRIRQVVELPDNPAIRGMVFHVRHLVKVEEVQG